MHFRKVLIPVDFSPPSKIALGYALAFARRFRARLTLLHVIEPSAMLTLTFPDEAAQVDKNQHEESQRRLAAMLAPEDERDLDIETLVTSGHVEEQILSTINEKRIDLLVMSNRRRGIKVLREVQIPAVTMVDIARRPAFDRILLATDFSEASREALHRAIDLAQAAHAKVAAVHAVEVGVDGGAEAAEYLGQSRVQEARAQFDQLKSEASHGKIELETIVLEGPAAGTILKAAEDTLADLIVITKRSLFGPVAERVIREAHTPVLTIPVMEKAKSERAEDSLAA